MALAAVPAPAHALLRRAAPGRMIPVVQTTGCRHAYGEPSVEKSLRSALSRALPASFRGFLWLIRLVHGHRRPGQGQARPPSWYAPYALGATLLPSLTLLAVLFLRKTNNGLRLRTTAARAGPEGRRPRRFGRSAGDHAPPWPTFSSSSASRPLWRPPGIVLSAVMRIIDVTRHRLIAAKLRDGAHSRRVPVSARLAWSARARTNRPVPDPVSLLRQSRTCVSALAPLTPPIRGDCRAADLASPWHSGRCARSRLPTAA